MFSTHIAALKDPLNENEKITKNTMERCLVIACKQKPLTTNDFDNVRNIIKFVDPSRVLPVHLDESEARKEALKFVVSNILKWSQFKVARFVLHSDLLRQLCEQEETLRERWITHTKTVNQKRRNANLKAFGTPDVDLRADNGPVKHTVFDHFRSQYYVALFELPKGEAKPTDAKERVWLIAEAIKLGSFDALTFRSAVTVDALQKDNALPEERKLLEEKSTLTEDEKRKLQDAIEEKKETIIQKTIMEDIKQLCSLYGEIGYAMAGKLTYNIAEYYNKNPTKENAVRRDAYIDEAVRLFLCASLLEKDADSKHLMDVITKGQGVQMLNVSILVNNAKDWAAAKEVLLTWYPEKARFHQLYDGAKAEIAARQFNQAPTSTVAALRRPLSNDERIIKGALEGCINLARKKEPLTEKDMNTVQRILALPGYTSSVSRPISEADARGEAAKYVASTILKWPQSKVIHFILHSEILRQFCEQEKSLQQHWVEQIKVANEDRSIVNGEAYSTPDIALKYDNNRVEHAVFDQYCSQYYYALYEVAAREAKPEESEDRNWLLNECVKLGSFIGLTSHAVSLTRTVKSGSALPEEQKLIAEKATLSRNEKLGLLKDIEREKDRLIADYIVKDAKDLCHLYGEIGYAMGAKLLSQIAVFYNRNPRKKRMRDVFVDETVRLLLCASLLENDPDSKYLLNTITNGQGLKKLGVFKMVHDAKDWSEARKVLEEKREDKARFQELFDNAKKEIASRHAEEKKPAMSTMGAK